MTSNDPAPADPIAGLTLDDVAREHPRWRCWEGVSGLLYARLLRSSPAVVVRAGDPTELHDSIQRAEADLT